MPLAKIAAHESIPVRTLRRWVARYREHGVEGLEQKPRCDKGRRRKISADLADLVTACALQKPRLPVQAIQRKIAVIAGHQQVAAPTYSVVYDIIRRLDPALLTLAHAGNRAYREKYELIHRREAAAPNELWQADHALLDLQLLNAKGEPARPWLTVIIDDYSRAVAGYCLSFDAPCAVRTALALRQAVWRKDNPAWQICGIPEALYADNGSDFTSEHIEQACISLKIRMVHSLPGRPQGRGRIERLFLTITQELLTGLPGYAPGNQPASPPQLRLNEFAELLEGFLVDQYHRQPHSATGVAPVARWNGGGFLPRMPDSLEQLDGLLLQIVKPRKVQRDGIRFQGMRYIDTTLAAFVGESVEILYDPRDLAEIQVYFQGEFLCRAVCQDIAGNVLGMEDIRQARQQQKAGLRRQITAARSVISAAAQPDTPPDISKPSVPVRRLKLYRQ